MTMQVNPTVANYYIAIAYFAVVTLILVSVWRGKGGKPTAGLVWGFGLSTLCFIAFREVGYYTWTFIYWLSTPWSDSTLESAAVLTSFAIACTLEVLTIGRLLTECVSVTRRCVLLFACLALLILTEASDSNLLNSDNVYYLATYSVCGVYIALAATLLMPLRGDAGGQNRIRLLWLLVIPIVVFVACWYAGQFLWPTIWIAYSSLFLSDLSSGDGWKLINGITSLSCAVVAFSRFVSGYASPWFLRRATLSVVSLVIITAGVFAYPQVALIDGWTDLGAAQNAMRQMGISVAGGSVRLVREVPTRSQSPLYSSFPVPENYSSFVVYKGERPINHIVVMPYLRYWWRIQYTGSICESDE